MAENIIKLIARFVHADTGKALNGPGLRVRFLDRDALKDDLLGVGGLSADGRSEVLTTTSSFRSGLLGLLGAGLGESKPDIYCEVCEGETPIFRTAVAWNVATEKADAVSKATDRTIDLGTFTFRRGEGLDDAPTPGGAEMRAGF